MVSHIGKSLLYINGGILSGEARYCIFCLKDFGITLFVLGAAVIPSLNAYSKTDAYVSMLKKV